MNANNSITPMENVNTNDLAPASAINNLVNPANSFFCSIPNDGSRENAVKIYNAINSKGDSLDDHIGEILEIVNIAAHPVNILDENSGEIKECLRTVLIDKNGKNYDAVSEGIASSLQRIFAIVGQPPYAEPLKVKMVQVKTRKGFKTNTLELV